MLNRNLLRSKIARKGITQNELAAAIGVNKNTLSSKMNGKKPFNTDEIDKICEFLEIESSPEKAEIFLQ